MRNNGLFGWLRGPVFGPDDAIAGGPAAVAAAPVADAGSVLYPADPVVATVDAKTAPAVVADAVKVVADPAVVADPVADPKVEPAALPAADPADDAAAAAALAAKEADKVARKAELDAMTPEARAKAEADDAAAEAAEVLANTIPEDGVYALTMPEGVTVDADLVAALAPEFKDLLLSNGQAQKLADAFIKAETAKATRAATDRAAMVDGWAATAKADPAIGGPKWDATVANATAAIKRFGSPGLKALLDASGFGNHPDMIAFAAKAGAATSEDDPADARGGLGGKPAAVDNVAVLYPNDLPKGN